VDISNNFDIRDRDAAADRLGSDSAPLASAAAGFSVPAQLFAT
jgi:hypothetical protein